MLNGKTLSASMETKATEVENEDERVKLISWLKWARGKTDWLDPLVDKDDEILGEGLRILDLLEDD